MKKGFTLVEMLAVIIILGIIVLIAIPRVNNVILDSRNTAYKENNKNIIRAAENYLNTFSNDINLEIGESFEVSFLELKEANFLNEVVNPHGGNVCSGYVIFTKVSEINYSTLPITDCVNNDVNSSEQFGLVLYYNFDTFAETTENIITNYNFDAGWNHNAMNNIKYDELECPKGTTSFGFDRDGEDPVLYATVENANKEASETYTPTLYVRTRDSDFNVTYFTADSSEDGRVWGESKSVPNDMRWHRIEWDSFVNPGHSESTRINYRFYSSEPINDPNSRTWICAPQLEQKNKATPFVEGVREDTIVNNVNEIFNSTLILNNTPKWVEDSKLGRGSYYFDGQNKYIRSDLELDLSGDQTFAFWMKPEVNTGLQGLVTLHNHSQTTNLGVNLHNDNITLSVGYTDGTREYNDTRSNSSVIFNEWQHIVVTYIESSNQVDFYINGKHDKNATLPKEVDFDAEMLLIGQWSLSYMSNYMYQGFLDDVMIFDRSFDQQEANQLYLSSLR